MKRALAMLLVSAMVLFFAVHVSAATMIMRGAGGLGVSPAIEQLALAKGQDKVSFSVLVTNDSASPVTLVASVDDFTALNSTGSALFLNNTTRLPAPHGLAHWMQPMLSEIMLGPHASKLVPVTISNASSLAPGGHYGAVIFKVVPSATQLKNSLSANAAVSVLVFLTTYNSGREAVALSRPQLSTIAVDMPDGINLVFANSGDVQTTPRGVVVITDRSGHEVVRGIVNVESGLVLPQTSRLYQVQLKTEWQYAWPGMYHLSAYYRAGNSTVVSRYDATFFYVSPLLVSLLMGGLAILLVFAISRMSGAVRRYAVKA